jgi:CubicO group peptidase (beta-lactamase class C family)
MPSSQMSSESLGSALDGVVAATSFAGVVRVDLGDQTVLARGYGLADRRHAAPATVDTRFAVASASKGFTALVVVSLVADGALTLDTTARSLLGANLPLIGDDVTVEQLLAHTSGIGDYFEEDDDVPLDAYLLPVPVHRLVTTVDYLPILDGYPSSFAPGERFAYCNGGFVVLALLAERASGVPFHDLVQRRMLDPAGMDDTAYLRSDELPERTATGYLSADEPRTNVLHLPVRGSGDGGAYTTVADVHAFWTALVEGRIVPPEWVERMTRPGGRAQPADARGYGLGFWLRGDDVVALEGCDTGVSFRSEYRRSDRLSWTVIGNTTDGAWPVARLLTAEFG